MKPVPRNPRVAPHEKVQHFFRIFRLHKMVVLQFPLLFLHFFDINAHSSIPCRESHCFFDWERSMGSQPQAIPVDETIFSKSLSEFEMSIPYSSTPPPTPRDSRQPSPPHTHHHLQQHHHHQKQSHSQSDHQYSTRPHLDEWWKNLSELNEHQVPPSSNYLCPSLRSFETES